ncbi:unnamed protein product, partial [Urochloa humidicola]
FFFQKSSKETSGLEVVIAFSMGSFTKEVVGQLCKAFYTLRTL